MGRQRELEKQLPIVGKRKIGKNQDPRLRLFLWQKGVK
jgi:hypothetical protein